MTKKSDEDIQIDTLYKEQKPFSLDQNIVFEGDGEKLMGELDNIESFSKDLEEDILDEVSKDNNVINLFNRGNKK